MSTVIAAQVISSVHTLCRTDRLEHTYYTQVNMARTIEQILGLPPMNQFDLVASPMRPVFVKGTPPADNFKPWTHVPNQVPLDEGVTASADKPTDNAKIKHLRAAWLQKKAEIFAGKLTKPNAEDPGHRQPFQLVHVHRVYAAVSWREDGSPSERLQQPGTRRRRLGRLKHVPTASATPRLTGEWPFFSSYNAASTADGRSPAEDLESGRWRRDQCY